MRLQGRGLTATAARQCHLCAGLKEGVQCRDLQTVQGGSRCKFWFCRYVHLCAKCRGPHLVAECGAEERRQPGSIPQTQGLQASSQQPVTS